MVVKQQSNPPPPAAAPPMPPPSAYKPVVKRACLRAPTAAAAAPAHPRAPPGQPLDAPPHSAFPVDWQSQRYSQHPPQHHQHPQHPPSSASRWDEPSHAPFPAFARSVDDNTGDHSAWPVRGVQRDERSGEPAYHITGGAAPPDRSFVVPDEEAGGLTEEPSSRQRRLPAAAPLRPVPPLPAARSGICACIRV